MTERRARGDVAEFFMGSRLARYSLEMAVINLSGATHAIDRELARVLRLQQTVDWFDRRLTRG